MPNYGFRFEKLVRDKVVPQTIEEGCRPHYHTLSPDELLVALLAKLHEESDEVKQAADARDTIDLCKELADVMEVVLAIGALHGLDATQIEAARLAKRERKGGFDTATFVSQMDIPDDHEELPDFLAQPEKYPSLGLVDEHGRPIAA